VPQWPLTGIPTDEEMDWPAIAVKLDNSASGRPQIGLEYADIVWQEVVEGGITRLAAIFHSQIPDYVEPIRSVRPTDIGIVAPLGGVLVFSGGQKGFVDRVKAAGVQTIIHDAGHKGFARDPNRPQPYNVRGTMQRFLDQAAKDRTSPPPPQFTYAREPGGSTAATEGTPAQKISIFLSPSAISNWTWNAKDEVYELSWGNSPAKAGSGVRITAKNVLAIEVAMIDTGTKDRAGSPVPEMLLTSIGTGLLAAGGKTIDVIWKKPAEDAIFEITDQVTGEPVTFEQGNTWIHTVPYKATMWTVDSGRATASPSPSPTGRSAGTPSPSPSPSPSARSTSSPSPSASPKG
jgi:hypothetical protein